MCEYSRSFFSSAVVIPCSLYFCPFLFHPVPSAQFLANQNQSSKLSQFCHLIRKSTEKTRSKTRSSWCVMELVHIKTVFLVVGWADD